MAREALFVKNGNRTTCVICLKNVAVLKEYNIPCHYEAKHLSTHATNVGKLWAEKFEAMKEGLESQRNLFTKKWVQMNNKNSVKLQNSEEVRTAWKTSY